MSTAAPADTIESLHRPLTERERMEAWLRTPESDELVPAFVERELAKPREIDFSGWEPIKLDPDFAERVVGKAFRRREGKTMGRRKKGRIPRPHKLAPGRWDRDSWFSVARAGAWSLRVHHKRHGWRAHVRCGAWYLVELAGPAASRAAAERAILEAAEGLCAGVQSALDSLRHQPLSETFPDPPPSDPGWRKREPGRWYRTASTIPPSVPTSAASCGAFRLRVFRGASREWCASVESGAQPIFVEWSLGRTKIRSRDQGETLALAGARMRLAEIRDALESLRGDVEAPPRSEPTKGRPPEAP